MIRLFGFNIISDNELNTMVDKTHNHKIMSFEDNVQHIIYLGEYFIRNTQYVKEGHIIADQGRKILNDLLDHYR